MVITAVISKGWGDFASLISFIAPKLCFLVVCGSLFLAMEAACGLIHRDFCQQQVWDFAGFFHFRVTVTSKMEGLILGGHLIWISVLSKAWLTFSPWLNMSFHFILDYFHFGKFMYRGKIWKSNISTCTLQSENQFVSTKCWISKWRNGKISLLRIQNHCSKHCFMQKRLFLSKKLVAFQKFEI